MNKIDELIKLAQKSEKANQALEGALTDLSEVRKVCYTEADKLNLEKKRFENDFYNKIKSIDRLITEANRKVREAEAESIEANEKLAALKNELEANNE